MPIKEENKKRYPENWKQISERIRFERAGNKCEVCGIANGTVIKRTKDGYRLPSQTDWDMINSRIKYSHSSMTESLKYYGFTKIVLTVAHLDHQPENCEDDNLKAMCQKCHNNYDRQHRNTTIRQSRLKDQLSIF